MGSWLKNLRLHKYGSLFSQLSYEEMLKLNEDYLENKVHVNSKSWWVGPYIFGLSQYFSGLWNLMTLVINILVHIHFCGHSQQQKSIKQVMVYSVIPKNIYTPTQVGSSHISPLAVGNSKMLTYQFRQAFQLTSSFHLWCFLNIFKPENTTTWKNVTYVFSLLKSRTNNSCCCLN